MESASAETRAKRRRSSPRSPAGAPERASHCRCLRPLGDEVFPRAGEHRGKRLVEAGSPAERGGVVDAEPRRTSGASAESVEERGQPEQRLRGVGSVAAEPHADRIRPIRFRFHAARRLGEPAGKELRGAAQLARGDLAQLRRDPLGVAALQRRLRLPREPRNQERARIEPIQPIGERQVVAHHQMNGRALDDRHPPERIVLGPLQHREREQLALDVAAERLYVERIVARQSRRRGGAVERGQCLAIELHPCQKPRGRQIFQLAIAIVPAGLRRRAWIELEPALQIAGGESGHACGRGRRSRGGGCNGSGERKCGDDVCVHASR